MAVPFLPPRGKKGKSHMVSSHSIPWYNRPARPFPALIWVQQRYGFRLPPLFFAQPAHAVVDSMARSPFPARVWLEQRQRGE